MFAEAAAEAVGISPQEADAAIRDSAEQIAESGLTFTARFTCVARLPPAILKKGPPAWHALWNLLWADARRRGHGHLLVTLISAGAPVATERPVFSAVSGRPLASDLDPRVAPGVDTAIFFGPAGESTHCFPFFREIASPLAGAPAKITLPPGNPWGLPG
jgi:hypothetical protein